MQRDIERRIARLAAERKARPADWGSYRYDALPVYGSPSAYAGVFDHGRGRVLTTDELLAVPLRELLGARCVRTGAGGGG